jgi:signal transduction histidine kinase
MSIYLSSLQFSLNLNIPSCYSRLGKPKIYSMMSIGGIVLGLFIAKSLIEAHGGRICAENNTDEKGYDPLCVIYC